MSAESHLFDVLSGHAGLAAVVGSRIYPDALPESCAYPALLFSREATDPLVTIDGTHHGEFVTLQLGAWARTRTEADNVADLVQTALQLAGEQPTSRQAGFDPETGLFGTTLGVTLFI